MSTPAHLRAALAYQRRHTLAGRCRLCPRPAARGSRCEVHYAAEQARRKARTPDARPVTCGLCGKARHNRRTCLRRTG